MTAPSPTYDAHGAADEVPTGRLFARTCAAEWTRLWTVKATWWFLAAAAVTMVGLGAIAGFDAANDPVHLRGEPAWQTASFIAIPAQLALLALVLTAVTSDYATGGIVPALQWTPRRTTLLLARTIVATGAATTLGVVLAFACALAAFGTAESALILPLDDGLDMVATVAFVFAAGTSFAVGLGFLLRSTAGALVTVLLLVLVLPPLLLQSGYEWLSALAELLPGSCAVFLLTGQPNAQGMTDASSMSTMLVWAGGGLLLGWLRLTRDDANR